MGPRHLLPAIVALGSCNEPVIVSTNDPPLGAIRRPADGDVFDEGEPIEFVGEVSDDKGVSNLAVEWLRSGVPLGDGSARVDASGLTTLTVADLPVGGHTITLRAVDVEGLSFETSVSIQVQEVLVAPNLTILRPGSGDRGERTAPFQFEVQVSDPQSPPTDLDAEVNSDLDGFLCAFDIEPDGLGTCQAVPSSDGNHRLTFTVVDPEGNERRRTTTWPVDPLPEDPSIRVVRPAPDTILFLDQAVTYEGTASDRQDPPDLLQVTISSDLEGELCDAVPISTGEVSCVAVHDEPGRHRVRFEVLDTDGNTGSATTTVLVSDGTDVDRDGDGYCPGPVCIDGSLPGDCDDTDPEIYPGAPERPNGKDDNCNGEIDEGTINVDNDGDGYCANPTSCTDGSLPGDCDDNDPTVNPGAQEICFSGKDENCNGRQDENGALGCEWWYADDDGDGFGNPEVGVCSCARPTSGTWVRNNLDCDDTDPLVFPGAPERPNGKDDNCNGQIDEGTINVDNDGDGYCANPNACTDGSLPGDCNDNDPTVNPGATEVCFSGKDEDCSGAQNDGFDDQIIGGETYHRDMDGDGFGDSATARRYCQATGAWTVLQGGDCYDNNAFAYPGPRKSGDPTWFTQDRGDGSFDYDCDGTSERRWTRSARCAATIDLDGLIIPCGNRSGWVSSTPSCGQEREWSDYCEYTRDLAIFGCFFSLGPNDFLVGPEILQTSSRTQECR